MNLGASRLLVFRTDTDHLMQYCMRCSHFWAKQMSSQSLSDAEIQAVKQALITRRSEKGDLLLGAQLGQLIAKTIAPRLLRDLPILRDLAEDEFRELVELVPDALSTADVQYRIIADQTPVSLTHQDLKSVSGPELWKFFSNPNQSCSLAIEPAAGIIYVAPLRAIFPVGLQKFERMDSEDYRVLAGQFAAQQDSPLREKLEKCLVEPHYYDLWIAALRAASSPERKLLKIWEILRTEHIAKRLGERLTIAGVSVALQAEIISAARARKKPATQQVIAQETAPASIVHPWSAPHTADAVTDNEALERLREIVHASVDRMSITELREVRIPAGILLDVAQQKRS